MVMRNPEPIEPIEVKEIVETKSDPPVVEESTNGEQAEQPPVIEGSDSTPEVQSQGPAASVAVGPSPERVSALAVVSVVSSLLGFLGITSLLGLALGIVALKQMAVNPQLSGRHLAIMGVCLSVFWLVLLVTMGSFLWVGLELVKALFNAIF